MIFVVIVRQKSYFLDKKAKFMFIIIIAISIKTIPIHCVRITFSPKITNAIRTETGNSKAETILPKPIPVNGNPAFKSIGGIMVPNKESTIPHFKKIEKLNSLAEENTPNESAKA